MARNDDGEFELVLGNRQLISVFIIVVILFAVFFSMGYIIGHNNTAPVSASNTNTKPSAVDHTATSAPATTAAQEPAPTTAEAKPPRTDSPATTPTHQEQAAAPRPVTPAPVAATPPLKEKPSPVPPNATARVLAEPAGGEYFQVVATTRPDAEIISEALGKKGFHSVISPSPKEGIFRVLVGPIKDSSSQGQMRADLEAAGFKSPILRKY